MNRWSPAALPLRWKLQLAFLGVGLLAVGITGLLTYDNARTALEKVTYDRLTAIRDTKKRQMETSFRGLRDQVAMLSEDQSVREGCSRRETALRTLHATVFPRAIARFGFSDLLLLDETGTIILAQRDSSARSQTPMQWPRGGPIMDRTFRSALKERNTVCMSDMFIPPDQGSPVSYLAVAISSDTGSLGVLMARLSIDAINQVMTSENHWKAEGLGISGETYIVGEDTTLRTDSRFFIESKEQYFHLLAKAGVPPTIPALMRARGTSILVQRVATTAALTALQGRSFVGLVRDYRGVQVVSAAAPLSIPGLRWAILAEIDSDEAFAAVYAFREQLLLGGVIILLIAGVFSVAVARTVARPLLQLVAAAQQFGDRGHASPVAVHSHDEIGLLARQFNAMVESIAANTARLEREVGIRKIAEDELRVSEDRLRNLSTHLQSAREEERKALAREIHDELGQSLTSLKLNLGILRDEHGSSVISGMDPFASLLSQLDGTIKSVRRLITDLRPHLLDDLGLAAAIEWLVDEFSRRMSITCKLHLSDELEDLNDERAISVFRIVQEALTNVARHARATEVFVRLERVDPWLEIRIQDNGVGMQPERRTDPRAFGLLGIRERVLYWGGSVEFQGGPGVGTTLFARITLQGGGHVPRDDRG